MIMTDQAKRIVFDKLYELTGRRIRRSAKKYALACPGPLSDAEDFAQNVYTKLYEWLDDPVHLEQAEGLLETPTEASKFIQQFARARICDHIDMNCAGPRDQRQTLHASNHTGSVYGAGSDGETLLELLVHPPDQHVLFDGLTPALAIEDIKVDLPALSKRLLDVLVDPPDAVREAFWESRIKVSRGMATLAEPATKHDESVLTLACREGYSTEDAVISWPGGVQVGKLDTTVGPALLETAGSAIVIRFEAKLTVHVNRRSLEGVFLRESIRPSPRAFDVGVVADYLGVKMQPLRFAWDDLRAAMGMDAPRRGLDVS